MLSQSAADVSFRFPPQSDAIGDGSRFQEVGTGPLYRLEIPNCRLEDTGAYSILARNEHGECRAVISLQVYGKGELRRRGSRPRVRGAWWRSSGVLRVFKFFIFIFFALDL